MRGDGDKQFGWLPSLARDDRHAALSSRAVGMSVPLLMPLAALHEQIRYPNFIQKSLALSTREGASLA